MINFIETLFGVAALSAILALVLWARRKRSAARRAGIAAAAALGVAIVLEVYVRTR